MQVRMGASGTGSLSNWILGGSKLLGTDAGKLIWILGKSIFVLNF